MFVWWGEPSPASRTPSNDAALSVHVPSASINFPLIFPFAATVSVTSPSGGTRSCASASPWEGCAPSRPSPLTPSNVPTAHAGSASTNVSIWYVCDDLPAVVTVTLTALGVTVTAPVFLSTFVFDAAVGAP